MVFYDWLRSEIYVTHHIYIHTHTHTHIHSLYFRTLQLGHVFSVVIPVQPAVIFVRNVHTS